MEADTELELRRNGKKAQIRPNKREKRAKQQSLSRRRHDRSIEIIFVCDVKEGNEYFNSYTTKDIFNFFIKGILHIG